jgi:hypothetical protein
MKQVFFSNAVLQAASTAGTDRFSDLVSNKLGFWTLDARTGGAWFATSLFSNTVDTDTSGGDTADDAVVIANPLMLKRSIQVVQGFTSGNPIATPIIETNKIVRVTAAHYEASTQHAGTVTFAAGDSGDQVQIKFIIRKQPTGYLDFVHNENIIADLSGGGYAFPLTGFNTTNHKAINITASGTTDNGAGEMVTAIQNNSTLNAMFSVSQSSGVLTVTARHAGVIFEMIADNLTSDTSLTVANGSAKWAPGTGNDWQARADELQARSQAGNFNRMYFPQTFQDFAVNGGTYDRFEITYKIDGDRDVVKGSQYGTAIIYEVTNTDAAGASVCDVLNGGTPPTAGQPVEYLF